MPRFWIRTEFADGIPRRAAISALIVASLLTLINQFEAFAGNAPIVWSKVALTFAVPYAVATVGAVGAKSGATRKPGPCQAQDPSLGSARAASDGDSPVRARVHVTLKPGVLDPEGKAIHHALATLGFPQVSGVRQGKYLEIELDEADPGKARADIEAMCESLLANTVIENYTVELDT